MDAFQGKAQRYDSPRGSISPINVVGITQDGWYDQWMNRQHMMWAMKDWCSVLYVQEPRGWYRRAQPRDERFFSSRYIKEQDSLGVLQLPKSLAFRAKPGGWNRSVVKMKGRKILRKVVRNKATPLVLYLWEPQLVDYARVLQPDVLIYHMFDLVKEYYHADSRGLLVQDQFQRLCREADIVLAGTSAQAEAIPRDDVQIFPNAVQFDWYRENLAEPDELKGIKHPRIGYIGSLNSKVAFDWFETISENLEWQVIIGGKTGIMREEDTNLLERLRRRKNVHFVDRQPPERVPQFLAHLDVGLLNYRRGGHPEFSSPLKLSEYSAAGLPIVGTPLRAMAEDPEAQRLVRFVANPAEAVDAIGKALMEQSEEDRLRRREYARQNSWQVRSEHLFGLIQEKIANPS